jgi:hypothetical protein
LTDADWMVIKRPYGVIRIRPEGGRPIGRSTVGHPQGVFGVFIYYCLVMLFLKMVCLTVAFA